MAQAIPARGSALFAFSVFTLAANVSAVEPPTKVLDALESAFPTGCYVAPKARMRPERCANVEPELLAVGDAAQTDQAMLLVGDVVVTVAWLDQKPLGEDLNSFFKAVLEKAGSGKYLTANGAPGWDRATYGTTKVYTSEFWLDAGPRMHVDLFHDGRRLVMISSVFAEGSVQPEIVRRQDGALRTVFGAESDSNAFDPETAPAYERGRRFGERVVLVAKLSFGPRWQRSRSSTTGARRRDTRSKPATPRTRSTCGRGCTGWLSLRSWFRSSERSAPSH